MKNRIRSFYNRNDRSYVVVINCTLYTTLGFTVRARSKEEVHERVDSIMASIHPDLILFPPPSHPVEITVSSELTELDLILIQEVSNTPQLALLRPEDKLPNMKVFAQQLQEAENHWGSTMMSEPRSGALSWMPASACSAR